jgi:hypothetical protein
MRRSLLLLLALATTACTTFDLDDVWTRPDTTVAQSSRDDWECRRHVTDNAYQTVDLYVGGLADAVRVVLDERFRDQEYAQCMGARGYRRVSS